MTNDGCDQGIKLDVIAWYRSTEMAGRWPFLPPITSTRLHLLLLLISRNQVQTCSLMNLNIKLIYQYISTKDVALVAEPL